MSKYHYRNRTNPPNPKKQLIAIGGLIYVIALIGNPQAVLWLTFFIAICFFAWKMYKNKKQNDNFSRSLPVNSTQEIDSSDDFEPTPENKVISIPVPQKEEVRHIQPYKKQNSLLSPTERKFYYALEKVSQENNLHLFAKVRLEDLLWLPDNIEEKERFGLRNRIKSRHIDFVLCSYQEIKPILAIELDDSSHFRFDRQEQDNFKNEVLQDAGIPILRFPVERFYKPAEISDKIARALSQADFKD